MLRFQSTVWTVITIFCLCISSSAMAFQEWEVVVAKRPIEGKGLGVKAQWSAGSAFGVAFMSKDGTSFWGIETFAEQNLPGDQHSGWIDTTDVLRIEYAIPLLNRLIREHPEKPFLLRNRAIAFDMNDESAKAIADYSKLIRLNPGSREYLNRGILRHKNGEYDAAIADLTEAIRLKPDNAYAFKHRGVAHAKKKNYGKAIADVTRAIHLEPKNAEFLIKRACIYGEMNQLVKAIADLTKAIQFDPKSGEAYYWRSKAWNQLEEKEKSLTDMTQAISLDPAILQKVRQVVGKSR